MEITSSEDVYKRLGKRIIMELKKMPASRAWLSNTAGISRMSVNYIVNGQRGPSAYSLYRIAKALKVSTDYLLGLHNGLSENGKVFDAIRLIQIECESHNDCKDCKYMGCKRCAFGDTAPKDWDKGMILGRDFEQRMEDEIILD